MRTTVSLPDEQVKLISRIQKRLGHKSFAETVRYLVTVALSDELTKEQRK